MTDETLPTVEKNDEQIDEFGRYLLAVVVQKLDEVLEHTSVSTDQRRQICSLFTDNFAAFLDHGWLENGDKRLWPLLAFAERDGDSADTVGKIKRLIVPAVESFHSEGGAEGAVMFHFDDDEEAKVWMSFTSGLRGDD